MAVERSQVLASFKDIHLFSGLDAAEVEYILHYFTERALKPGEVLFSQGDPGDSFYILLDGEVSVVHTEGDVETVWDVLEAGDYLGEESLLYNRPRGASVSALGNTVLMKADRQNFHELLIHYPSIKVNLERIIQSRVFMRTHHFDWLNDDEVVYQVRRKHGSYLFLTLIVPVLIGLAGLVLFGLGAAQAEESPARTGLFVLGGLMTLIGAGWGVWNYLDWSNDYYIVTSQRVTWIEKVIWLYESRTEAPHSSIQAVNVNTTLLGRLLGYGDVTINTYTGKMILRVVGEPYQMAALIQEYWHRAQRSYQKESKKELEQAVSRIFDQKEEPAEVKKPAASPSRPYDYTEPGLWKKYFGGFFSQRIEEGGTITYRKHWLILLGKTWQPLVALLAILFAVALCSGAYWMEDFQLLHPGLQSGIALFLIGVVVLPWWLYNYIDWRNDIYQLTDRNIFDIERKPLGTEVKKSGSLEKILSLEHDRPGFLGYVFNVGNVIINFGDAKFDFTGVHEPARIQQDIFNRMHQLRVQQQKAEVARERDRILTLLEAYHHQVENAKK
jgi:hypothetical protein